MSRRKNRFKPKKQVSLTDSVIRFLRKNQTKKYNYKQLSAQLKITKSALKQELLITLKKLASEERILEVEKGKYQFMATQKFITGLVDLTSSGSAYIISEDSEKDIYISSNQTLNILDGDTVKVELIGSYRKGKPEGTIIEVLERKKLNFIGILHVLKSSKKAFVKADSGGKKFDIRLPFNSVNFDDDGLKVIVKIISWDPEDDFAEGEMVTVLGTPGEHEVEIHAILAEYDLPYEFPKEVIEEAEVLPIAITEEEIAKRRDMRGTLTFTIDPFDAKDFDDALSYKVLENGNYEVGIHIADVSHYVKPDTLLEKEGFSRATSVYLVDRVVPMLPEVLSNFVCSLRPNEEKLTFSAVFELDNNANIVDSWFGRTVIYSDRRYTYEEAQETIETGEGEHKEAILKLDELAKKLRKDRLKAGAITFDREEVRFKLDENNEPTDFYVKVMKDSNKLIEEFMLLANKQVARFIGKTKEGKPSGKTYVYRIHDEPDPEKLMDLKNFVGQFGYSINISSPKHITDSINQLLEDIKGKPEATMIETMTIRSMSKAKYSTKNIGHYGLAFDYYSHFTSPIRRYPDVMAHRLLQHYLDGKNSPAPEPYETKCLHSSNQEKMASSAERDSIKLVQVKMMSKRVGENFTGHISGITEWGVFVELPENKAEGMIKVSAMQDDRYKFDSKNYMLVGQRRKKIYQLGDTVRVKLVGANVESKQIDFEIINPKLEEE